MRKMFLALIMLFGICIVVVYMLQSSKTRFDRNLIGDLPKYQEAVTTLLDRKDSLLKNLDHDTMQTTIFESNRNDFENRVLQLNHNDLELRKLVSLWDQKLISDDDVVGNVWFDKHNEVGFTLKVFQGFFFFSPDIFHFLVYDPQKSFETIHNKYPYETIKQFRVSKNWTYIIQKRYFND